jgi:hypothetical protein
MRGKKKRTKIKERHPGDNFWLNDFDMPIRRKPVINEFFQEGSCQHLPVFFAPIPVRWV